MTAPYGPAEPDTHAHVWMIPTAEPGRTVYLAPCRLCAAVKTLDKSKTGIPGEAGVGWVELGKMDRRNKIGQWE